MPRLILLGIAVLLTGQAIHAETATPSPILITANNRPVNIANGEAKIPMPNDGIFIRIGSWEELENFSRLPSFRYTFKLEGFDSSWEWYRLADMGIVVRFYNQAGNVIKQHYYGRNGVSAGWKNSIDDSPLVSCRETLVVPNGASTVTIGLSSAGPPHSIGTYAATGLTIFSKKTNTILLPTTPGQNAARPVPSGWIRDGTHPSMAKILILNQTSAFCIADDDPAGHAEWRMTSGAPKVTPGDTLTIGWSEVYSIGSAQGPARKYPDLPPGKYTLLIKRIELDGRTVALPSIDIIVPFPYWRNPWFWFIVSLGTLTPILLLMRYIIKVRVRNQVKRLQQQHAVELERLRIARNLHDDLGARLTHISLVSDSAENEVSSLSEAKQGFHRLSGMTRELVAILYETVWSVDPENDHLASLVNYLGGMIVDLCEPSELHCRIHADEITDNRKVTSEIRHNISLAVKEAVHNALKYSHATEIIAKIHFVSPVLTIVIRDNGHGFNPLTAKQGHGLANMRQRMNSISGELKIESVPGKGTSVTFGISIS
jgi:signal transduction histidine kinase